MEEPGKNDIARNILSVVAGVLAAVAIGALLIPVVEPLFDKSFNLYFFNDPPAGSQKDDLIFELTLFGWLFTASFAGGFVCALISTNKDIIHVLISSLVSIVVVFFISGGEVVRQDYLFTSLLLLLSIPLGNLAGGWLGGLIKRKRKK